MDVHETGLFVDGGWRLALADVVDAPAVERAEVLAPAAGPDDFAAGDAGSIGQAEGEARVAVRAVARRPVHPACLLPVRRLDRHPRSIRVPIASHALQTEGDPPVRAAAHVPE